MRLRPRTIRTQLLALLLVPMISLAALWTYGSYTTLRGAIALTRINVTEHYYGNPAEDLIQALQDERLAAVEYDATSGSHAAAQWHSVQKLTDDKVAVMRDHLLKRERGSDLTADQNARAQEVLQALDTISGLRAEVQGGDINWFYVMTAYSDIIQPDFSLQSALTEQQSGEIARKGAVVVELGRARELLSEEDALVLGGHLEYGMTDPQYNQLIGDIDGRELLDSIYAPELPPSDTNKLRDFESGKVGWSLLSEETSARAASARTVQQAISVSQWRANAEIALQQLAEIDADAAEQVDDAAHDSGMSVLNRAALILLIGLIAVIASIASSWRIGRRIALRLTGLRDTAENLSRHRLPEMMRRLRDGDTVDDVEAWLLPDPPVDRGPEGGGAKRGRPLRRQLRNTRAAVPFAGFGEEFNDDEIGQVGRSFEVAQRAAVQAAVEQARLRRGVAAVFTTLARRSQVILHRQLGLLDTMERRAQDPAELADLFRLDHMTNRMRRQAEGLLIMSGLTPGRAWRRPVRMGEVVRAAVGEVEGYERIAVRRMPGVALVGAAVADVLHLLAELMENATAFSPPATEVVVSGQEVASGFTVEITDRGLGMNPERLDEANRAIEESAQRAHGAVGTAAIDLPESDRLGLFTVGRLSARHGVRVTLRRGATGGTVAVVLIPSALLSPPEEGEPRVETPEMAARAVPPGKGTHRAPTPRSGAADTRGRQEVAESVRTPRRSETAKRTTTAGLPKRVPTRDRGDRTAVVPVTHAKAPAERQEGADRERSPEEARSVIAAYSRGLARGRAESAQEGIHEVEVRMAENAPEATVDAPEVGENATENAIDKP